MNKNLIKKSVFGILLLLIALLAINFIDFLLKSKPQKSVEIVPVEADYNLTPPLTHSTSTNSFQFDPLIHSTASTTPQFILLSFDGSKSIKMWKETTDFADSLNTKGIPIHFTYFINSIYLLAEENRNKYTSPEGKIGESAIGFSDSLNSIDNRIQQINNAIDKGHEIASHTAGHWRGAKWSISEWQKEFSSFNDLLSKLNENNPQIKLKNSLKLKISDIKGFRAPELSINDNMYSALSLNGFAYDSSEVSMNGEWPFRDQKGIWHVPISTIHFSKLNKNIIAVDYSIWVHQTGAKDILKKGTKEWESAVEDVLMGYVDHFEKTYKSNRVPMVIDDHFATWNDGLYWEALKRFASLECGKPNVRCSTFSDLIRFVENSNDIKKQ